VVDNEDDRFEREKEITTKFIEECHKLEKGVPDKKSKEDLEVHFMENKEPSIEIQAFSKSMTQHLIKKMFESTPLNIEKIKNGIEEMRNELGYSNSSTIEQLLIDEIILEFFRMHNMQTVLTGYIARKETEDKKMRFIDQMVNSAQKRFYKSIQTLTRLRKTGINLQINIAAEGGKQVNINK